MRAVHGEEGHAGEVIRKLAGPRSLSYVPIDGVLMQPIGGRGDGRRGGGLLAMMDEGTASGGTGQMPSTAALAAFRSAIGARRRDRAPRDLPRCVWLLVGRWVQ